VRTTKALTNRKPGPHRSREQVRIFKKVGTLKAALISVGKPGKTWVSFQVVPVKIVTRMPFEQCAFES